MPDNAPYDNPLAPRYALFWSMAGDTGWTCVGLYETEHEACAEFGRWSSVYDGVLVVSVVDPLDERHVARAR